MADGITFQSSTLSTPPASSKIATDDTGSPGHVQIVKLAIAADGSATVLPGDATDGLLVNLGANNDVTIAKGATAFTDPACDTSADLLLAANSSRKAAIIQNVGTVDVYVGPSGVTTTSGLHLEPGASLTDTSSTSAWYGITASGTGDLRVCEVA